MLLSRLWYCVLGLLLGGLVFILYLAQSAYNRSELRALQERLQANSQVVSWYLKADARDRASQLIPISVDRKIAAALKTSNAKMTKVPKKVRRETLEALQGLVDKIPAEMKFDAVFIIDQLGRVVAHTGYERMQGNPDFELGGYPVVGDALRGYVRDDTLMWETMYRVVSRPVILEAGQPAAGAVLGVRAIDDRFAMELSERTGAAIAFYADGERRAAGVPTGFSKGLFDQITNDLKSLDSDEEYQTGGRTTTRMVSDSFGVVYAKLLGEAGSVGAGFVVGQETHPVVGLRFDALADEKDKESVSVLVVAALVLGALGIGIAFSLLEHTLPLRRFVAEASAFGKGKADQLQPSKFRGLYRVAASDINDGVDHAVAKGGGARRAADLKQVLGDIPDQPQMSAFSFPGEGSPDTAREITTAEAAVPSSVGSSPDPSRPKPFIPKAPPRKGAPTPQVEPASDDGGDDASMGTEASWRGIYEDFVRTKEQCGEDTESFTYEKFERTLRKNQGALMQRHGVTKVKFSVYVKDGRAALKASPMKG